ncbi:MAG: translation elongation factor Ts [Spirochaetales bacterium]|nr:translation elongation factor Ts [Spirochaetales bacterium]
MEIKASDVKILREKTGAGLLDCKNALAKANGDFKQAEKFLKEQGLAAAAKRAGRATNEGRIFIAEKDHGAAIIELSCETDFVAMNQNFLQTGEALVNLAAENKLSGPTPELELKVQETIAIIKENMSLRRLAYLPKGPGEVLSVYIHGAGKIGVIVKLKADKNELFDNPGVKEFVLDIALHTAAYNPLFLSRETVPQDYLKEQEEIFTVQAEKIDKPDNVKKGIIQGKINKHLGEICLLEQAFVKDEKQSVAKVLAALNKEIGGKIEITGFVFYRLGENLD